MKQIGLSILGLFLLFSCGEKRESEDIIFYNNKVEIDAALKRYAATYSEQNSVNVTINTCGGGCDYGAQVRAAFQSDREPDIFVVAGMGDYEVWSHKAVDLTDEPWVTDTDFAFTVGNRVFGFPIAIEGWGMAYNGELLREAGVDPTSLNSFEAYRSAFAAIESQKEALGINSVVSMAAGPEMYWVAWQNFNGYLAAGLAHNDTSIIDDFNNGIVHHDRLIQLAEWVDLLFQYADSRLLLQGNYDDQINAFINKKAVFIHQGNWIDPNLLEGGASFEMGYAPHGSLNRVTDGIFIDAASFYLINREGNVKGAKAFLNAMASTEEGHNYMVNEANMVPAFNSVTLKPQSPLSLSIIEWASREKIFAWQHSNLPEGFGIQILGPIYNQLALGNIDTAKFVELVTKRAEELNKREKL